MRNNHFFKSLLLLVSIVFFVSCDKDYNEIGDGLIGENHFDLAKDSLTSLHATWKKTGPIASNNLEINSLGVLDNDIFGQTTANFVTHIELASLNPSIDIDLDQEIESVTLYIPYFAKVTSVNPTSGRPVYELDSIYGTKTSRIKLKIYENKKILEDNSAEPGALSDPNYPQLYYTNENTAFSDVKGKLLYTNDAFIFSNEEYSVITTPATPTTAEVKTYTAPGMQLELDKEFFKELFFETNPGSNFSDNEVFKNYFRGLYFNVEKADAEGVLARMNFKRGTIVIKYKEKALSSDPVALLDKSITLNLTGNTVNLLSNGAAGAGYTAGSSATSDRLYIRGGEGSVAEINLFNSGVDVVKYNRTTKKIESGSNNIPDELDYIKEKKWLINEASLTFYVDQSQMTGLTEPYRIFLYDRDNLNIFSTATIEKDASGRGFKYKVRLTDYIRALIINDQTNLRLGVSLVQSVANVKFKKIVNPFIYQQWQNLQPIEKNAYFFPESSVTNPLGTILYGSDASVPEAKRLKLQIYYTEPN